MEIDEQNSAQDGGNLDGLNGLNEAGADADAPIPRRQRIKLETELIESPEGLSALYRTFVLNSQQGKSTLKLRGKGHDIGDFARVMDALKNWQGSFAPKFSSECLTDKLHKLSKSKKVLGYLEQLRDVYAGNINPDEVLVMPIVDKPEEEKPKDFKKHELGFIKTELTKEEAYFRMLDDARATAQPDVPMIDTRQRAPQNMSVPPGLTLEQMRTMEENRLKALAKKRRREQQEMEQQENQDMNLQTATGSKRPVLDEQKPNMKPIEKEEFIQERL